MAHHLPMLQTYLIDLISATAHWKDGVSMCMAFQRMIDKAEDIYGVHIVAFCCDNNGGSQQGRKDLVLKRPWLFGPPCCAHQVIVLWIGLFSQVKEYFTVPIDPWGLFHWEWGSSKDSWGSNWSYWMGPQSWIGAVRLQWNPGWNILSTWKGSHLPCCQYDMLEYTFYSIQPLVYLEGSHATSGDFTKTRYCCQTSWSWKESPEETKAGRWCYCSLWSHQQRRVLALP